jgi:transposase
MYKALPQITEALEDLEAQRKRTRDPQRRQRLHLLVLLRAGEVQNRQEAATHLAVHRNTIARWLTAYQRGGLAQLLTVEAPGAKPEQRTLSPAVLEILQERLAGEGFSSYGEVQRWLAEAHGVVVPYPTLHKLVRYRLGAKLKRARPVHAKKTAPMPLPFPSGSAASLMPL